jgi:hypothetical protein
MSQKLIRLSIHVSAESSATSSDYGAPRQPVATNDGSVIGRTAGATEQLAVDPLLPKSWTSGGQAPSPIDALVLPARTSSPRARRSSGHVLLALLLTPPRASPLMPPCGRAAGGVGGRRQPWEAHENIVSASPVAAQADYARVAYADPRRARRKKRPRPWPRIEVATIANWKTHTKSELVVLSR